MSRTVQKILSKHGIALKKQVCKRRFRVFDDSTETSLMALREEWINAFIQSKKSDESYIEELLTRVAKTEISRSKYKEFAKISNYEVIWGQGGHQKKRSMELENQGIKYIWIECLDE